MTTVPKFSPSGLVLSSNTTFKKASYPLEVPMTLRLTFIENWSWSFHVLFGNDPVLHIPCSSFVTVTDLGHCASRYAPACSFLLRDRCFFHETIVRLAHHQEAFVCASQGTVGICIGMLLSLRTDDIIVGMKTYIYVYIYTFRFSVHPCNFPRSTLQWHFAGIVLVQPIIRWVWIIIVIHFSLLIKHNTHS